MTMQSGWLGQRALQYRGQFAEIGVDGIGELFFGETGKLTLVPNLGDEYTPAEATLNRIFARLTQRIGAIIMTSAENAASGVADQLGKAKGEIDGVIADLQDQSVTPATIERLQNLSQALDDVVPDAVPAPAADAPVDGATDTST